MKILVTGFDPFGGESINPAYEAVKLLKNDSVVTLEIPTVFYKSIDSVVSAMKTHQPDVIICVGQAGGRKEIAIERVAINVDDARIKDNEGNQPIDQTIDSEGKNAYFSSLPIKAISKAIKEKGISAVVSNTAGTFVCNHIMYGVLNHIEKNNLNIRAGFIHVPYCDEQVVGKDLPSMSIETIAKALEIVVETCLSVYEDIHTIEGSIY